jgi:hypothetical protein
VPGARAICTPKGVPARRGRPVKSKGLLAWLPFARYAPHMIVIRFPDETTEKRALGFLARRFSGKIYATGETIVPEAALSYLAIEGIKFTVEGPATYERLTPLRDTAATAV